MFANGDQLSGGDKSHHGLPPRPNYPLAWHSQRIILRSLLILVSSSGYTIITKLSRSSQVSFCKENMWCRTEAFAKSHSKRHSLTKSAQMLVALSMCFIVARTRVSHWEPWWDSCGTRAEVGRQEHKLSASPRPYWPISLALHYHIWPTDHIIPSAIAANIICSQTLWINNVTHGHLIRNPYGSRWMINSMDIKTVSPTPTWKHVDNGIVKVLLHTWTLLRSGKC